jgi:multidrug resistance efflux pump
MTKKPKSRTRLLTTGAVVLIAAIAIGFLYVRYVRTPWTRDGQVSAKLIAIAPRVTGTVVAVNVVDNQLVSKGDLLFEIDPSDFELAVESSRVQLEEARQQVASLEAAVAAQEASVSEARAGIRTAEAQIESAKGAVAAAEGLVSSGYAGLQSAQASIDKSTAELDESIRERDRAAKLAEDGAGSVASAEGKAAAALAAEATLDGARANLLNAQATLYQGEASLMQARANLVVAEAGLGEADARLASALANLAQAQANLGVPGDQNVQIRAAKVSLADAELDLERTTVRAPTDGYVTNLNVDVGDYASPGTPMLAFVDSESFYVQGFFRETQLRHMNPGDRAVVTLMSHRNKPIEGVVESIGWAINPPDVATTEGAGGLVPQVEPSFDWIRLAQRVPVRVRIETVPEGVQLISGTTASVVIKPES